MSLQQRGGMPLEYNPVSYPGSVLRFRGPEAPRHGPYVLCLGGSETFGRFIPAPYAAQLDRTVTPSVVNMGVMNAGLDVMMTDPAIRATMDGACAVVLQITGAQNMTNRFYAVHPRRNDRFVKATRVLRTIYPDVDFTEFHFTRHLLTHLRVVSEDRFAIVVNELQTAWQARMARLIDSIAAPVHLLWLSNRHPDETAPDDLGGDPLFVTGAMLANTADRAQSLTVAVSPSRRGKASTTGMFFARKEAAAARVLPGPEAHDRAAASLVPVLQG